MTQMRQTEGRQTVIVIKCKISMESMSYDIVVTNPSISIEELTKLLTEKDLEINQLREEVNKLKSTQINPNILSYNDSMIDSSNQWDFKASK